MRRFGVLFNPRSSIHASEFKNPKSEDLIYPIAPQVLTGEVCSGRTECAAHYAYVAASETSFLLEKWCAQGDDLRTFLAEFVSIRPQAEVHHSDLLRIVIYHGIYP